MLINDVQFNTSLEDILNELVSQLRINGIQYIQKMKDTPKDIQICCPYHKEGMERRPSAGIRKTDGLFHCLACGETHSLQEMISFCFGREDAGVFGWKWLLKNFATVTVEHRTPIELDINRNRNDERPVEYVSEEELDSYRYYHSYWDKRGITDPDIIELFDLGYDKKSQCITFPIRDIDGNCLFVARRSVNTKWFNYPQGVDKPVYGLYELSELAKLHGGKWENEIIICESMLDALSFWEVGKYAVALNGTGTELQMKQLTDIPCRKFILCTDMDKAGMKARTFIRKSIRNKIITEYILPDGRKDANECTKEELKSLEEIF